MKFLLLIVLVLTLVDSYSQEEDTETVVIVEKMPYLKICEDYPDSLRSDCTTRNLMKYFAQVKYPKEAVEKNMLGRVISRFVVDRDGSVDEYMIYRSSGYKILDDAVLDHLVGMPEWVPGEQKGKKVKVMFLFPTNFKFSNNNVKSRGLTHPQYKAVYNGCERLDSLAADSCTNAKLEEYAAKIPYPVKAKKKHLEGEIFLEFVVDEQGVVSDCIIIEKSEHKLLNKAATEYVMGMPKWTQGSHYGKKAEVNFSLKISFDIK